MRIVILALILSFASGCTSVIDPLVYKLPKRQGNIIDERKMEQLKPGLNKRQVAYLLGSPLSKNPFNHSVWHYNYFLKDKNDKVTIKKLSLKFDGDILKTIDDQYTNVNNG